MGKRLLDSDGKKVSILENIKIDETLPKYQIINDIKESNSVNKNTSSIYMNSFIGTPDSGSDKGIMSYESVKKHFIEQSKDSVTDFNLTVTDTMKKQNKVNTELSSFFRVSDDSSSMLKPKWYHKLLKRFKEKKEEKREKKFDVVAFFSNVKNFTEDESNKYINRISEYVNCIGYTEMTGQVALKEKLFANLVINKYESILFAKGMYKAIDEKTIVQFAKSCPKELCMDYVANYTRNIPLYVIKKKVDADKLEIFDNYCVLHYDIDKENPSTEKTTEEKDEEVKKAKDPILFGLIAGSNKLYYIADWIDEYCDLQFETIVEMVGKEEIEKSYLKEKID